MPVQWRLEAEKEPVPGFEGGMPTIIVCTKLEEKM